MGAPIRDQYNSQLLNMSYKDRNNIKQFLRSWGSLESLSLRGDTVATCILVDLKEVTGIDLDNYDRHNRDKFNIGYKNGRLSKYQYMAISYVLVLGYSQADVAYVMGVDQSVISKNINSGIKKIIRELHPNKEADYE